MDKGKDTPSGGSSLPPSSGGAPEDAAEQSETTSGSTLEEVERDYILRVFRETGGVVSAAASRLGMPRTTLNAMMRKLGISRKDV